MSEIDLSQAQAKAVGVRIRDARRAAGFYQQAAFADACGISVSYVAKLESANQVPKDDEIYRMMASKLNVSLEWLLHGDEELNEATGYGRERITEGAEVAEDSSPYEVRNRAEQAVRIACRIMWEDRARQAVDTLTDTSGLSKEDIVWSMVKKELET